MTISANDLRVGSLFYPLTGDKVRLPSDMPHRILSIEYGGCRALPVGKNPANISKWPWFMYYDLTPIPLTEEWLRRFGFREVPNSPFVKFWRHESDVTFYHEYARDNPIIKLASEDFDVQIEWVHQTQNVIHALTGKELILNTNQL